MIVTVSLKDDIHALAVRNEARSADTGIST